MVHLEAGPNEDTKKNWDSVIHQISMDTKGMSANEYAYVISEAFKRNHETSEKSAFQRFIKIFLG